MPGERNIYDAFATLKEASPRNCVDPAVILAAELAAIGYVIVPREPTPEMIAAWRDNIDAWLREETDEMHLWRVMIGAAPKIGGEK